MLPLTSTVRSVPDCLSQHTANVLRLSGLNLGLLLNFNVEYLKDGIVRRAL